jgi:6-phosphogluconolactonase
MAQGDRVNVSEMNVIEYPSRDQLMQDVAMALAADLTAALMENDVVSFAVPGGTTPGPVFDALSAVDLDWSRVHVLLSDERWVPEDDAQSNAALIKKRLLVGHGAAARFTPYFNVRTDILSAAHALSDQLAELCPIDVLLLGMGADMHTASLFPKSDGLDAAMASDAPMFLPITVSDQDVQRFTLTAPALRGARKTHLLITGDDKREALARAHTLPPETAPVQIVLSNATIHWSAT